MNWFKKKQKESQTIIGHELSVPIKDLGLCLYGEYEKVEALKQKNNELQDSVSKFKALQTENTTQLAIINQLKRETEQKDRDNANLKAQILREGNRVEEHKSEIWLLKADILHLKKQIEDTQEKLYVPSYNQALDDCISELETYKNLGKNQAICVVSGMKKAEAMKRSPVNTQPINYK